MILRFVIATVLFFVVVAKGEDVKPPSSKVEKLLAEQNEETFKLGKVHYQKYCIACHATSNMMVAAPKFGSQNDWGSRLMSKKDINGLVKVAVKGTGAMPAKGLCAECKEKDLKAAIVYMMRGQE